MSLPTQNELILKTWLQIEQFMNEVQSAYIQAGYTELQADENAVKWGNQIFNNPNKAQEIMNYKWDTIKQQLKKQSVISKTVSILLKADIPSSTAAKYAEDYANELRNSIHPEEILNLQTRMQNLFQENYLKNKGKPYEGTIIFPNPYSTNDLAKLMLQGNWIPLALTIANKKGTIIENTNQISTPPLTENQVKMALESKNANPESNELWKQIFAIVGLASLATLIYKTMVKLYKQYKANKNNSIVAFSLLTPLKYDYNSVWSKVKEILNVDSKTNIKTVETTPTTIKTEMKLVSDRQPSVEELKTIITQLRNGLSNIKPQIKLISQKHKLGNITPLISISV